MPLVIFDECWDRPGHSNISGAPWGRCPRHRLVKAGQVYRWLFDVWTRAGHVMQKDSLIEVLDSTQKTPHGEIGESGTNWICRDMYQTSVWATLEQCLSRGLLELVPDRR
jgi:hypothetical protein